MPQKATQLSFDQSRRNLLSSIVTLPVFIAFSSANAHAEQARFVGSVVAEWNDKERTMKLVRPYEFIDSSGRRWPVPAGAEIDGASIPQIFWSLIGGPFEGLYRSASVIHDYYCFTRTRNHVDVHKVFHEAMLISGVRRSMAYIMYKAVTNFGPVWADPKLDPRCEAPDENYDFEVCTRNSFRPSIDRPEITQEKLEIFANSLEGEVDADDLGTLRQAIRQR